MKQIIILIIAGLIISCSKDDDPPCINMEKANWIINGNYSNHIKFSDQIPVPWCLEWAETCDTTKYHITCVIEDIQKLD